MILAKNQQNEAAGNAGKYHRTDGNRSAEEYEPQCVGRLGRGECAYGHAEHDASDQKENLAKAPAGNAAKDEYRRRDDQTEEKCPRLDREVAKQGLHHGGKGYDADADSDHQRKEEPSVDMPPELLEPSGEEQLHRLGVDRCKRCDELIVYPHNEGDSTAGHARNHICRTHTRAFDGRQYIFGKFTHILSYLFKELCHSYKYPAHVGAEVFGRTS